MRIEDLENRLVVSCQPVPGGPMDDARSVVGFALAALEGGASALRIESLAYVRAVRAKTDAPIIGIVKQDRADTAVRITPTRDLAIALCDAGADVVAIDATRRPRPESVPDLIAAIRQQGKLVMADCSDIDDAREALAAGAHLVGSTMAGYTGGQVPSGPDYELLTAMRRLTPYVVAEGRVHTPAQAGEALRRGAFCVVVGSALTRTEHATAWFKSALDTAATASGVETVLAIDIGGTKTVAALTTGADVSDVLTFPTDRASGPDSWLAAIAQHFPPLPRRYSRVAAAVSGLVDAGHWSALNPTTLDLPTGYALTERLQHYFAAPAFAANDAQAAAWGEYRYGAGEGRDLVFLTISTGIGGGVVINGRPLLGLAGHFGLLHSSSANGPLENTVSGRWIASEAKTAGHDVSAVEVFAASARAEPWAAEIIGTSAKRVAQLCADIQLQFDPPRIVVGGGIGLAPGFLERVRNQVVGMSSRLRPNLVSARLGTHAGLIGVADLSLARLGP